MYRGHPAMLAWALHRLTGIAVLLFLLAHIIETSTLILSPDLYNTTLEFYRQAWFKPLEFMLVVAVLYHAGNGILVMLLDFWPASTRAYRRMFWAGAAIYVAVLIPVAYLMMGKLVVLR